MAAAWHAFCPTVSEPGSRCERSVQSQINDGEGPWKLRSHHRQGLEVRVVYGGVGCALFRTESIGFPHNGNVTGTLAYAEAQ